MGAVEPYFPVVLLAVLFIINVEQDRSNTCPNV